MHMKKSILAAVAVGIVLAASAQLPATITIGVGTSPCPFAVHRPARAEQGTNQPTCIIIIRWSDGTQVSPGYPTNAPPRTNAVVPLAPILRGADSSVR